MVVTRGWGQMLFKGTNLPQVVNKPRKSDTECSEYRQQHLFTIIKLAKTLELNDFSHKEGKGVYTVW